MLPTSLFEESLQSKTASLVEQAGENDQSSLTPMERYIRQTPNEGPWNHVWAGMRDNDK